MWLWNACWASRLLLLLSAASGLASGLSQFQRLELNKNPCPGACDPSGNTTKWFTYHSVDEFAACNEPILLNLNLYTPVDDDSTHTIIRACTLGNAHSKVNFLAASGYVAPDALGATNFGPSSPQRRDDSGSAASLAYGGRPAAKSNATAYLTKWKTSDPLSSKATEDVILAAQALQRNLKQETAIHGKKKIIFTYLHGTLIGLYSGSQVDLMQTSASMLDQFITALEGQDSNSAPSRKTLEICGGHCTASHIFGVVADAGGDFRAVQSIVKSWNDGELLSAKSEVETESVAKSSLWTFASNNATQHQHRRRSHVRHLNPRAECRSIRVEGKDTCTSLATRCGIGGTAFENFNKGTLNCRSPLQPGQPVCCSSGTLPDVMPDPNPDGSCAFHEVQEDEYCQSIAASYGLTTDDLFDLNKKTWAWDGCGNLLLGLRICVSEGFPPLPASVWNAECGPTVPDTKPPKEGEELAEMNPCPLDVCCNIWGMCGTTVDFCIPSNSTTGNPGTSAPKENGCIANCGMEMVNDNKPPELYKKIGYFEGWNYNRPCLTMHVDDIDDGYTHIHFAFGEFSSDMEVLIKEDVQEQWKAFIKADRDYKKVLSFGGWEFSNAPATSGLFRLAVSPDRRDTFAENVVKFAADNGLDGLDFDWEYPGATDIEGSDPGSEDDGENYLEFLKLVREKLPKGKSLSVATAASFWYLKGFPVKEMAPVLDYFIHMTYDFHGQWDVAREWSMDGCPAGNCLRSHVNSTQTHESLVMMTKAGVPSHKIVVGVTSYGRSFKMSDPTCRGPMCTFVGERNDSPAKPGRCTDTGGYISNFEILEIIDKGGAIKSWYDEATDSDYLVFNSVEWVAYMTDKTKDRRRSQYKGLNCGGTTDWAIDLQGEGRRANTGDPVYLDPIVYKEPDAWCEAPCVLVFPPSQLPSPTTIDPGEYVTSLLYGTTTDTTKNGETVTAFVTQTTTITIDLPAITTDELSYSNVNISRNQDTSSLWVGVRVPIAPVTVSLDDGGGGTTTRVLTLPAWPAVTKGPRPDGDDDDDDDDKDDEDWELPNPIETTGTLEPFEPTPTTLPIWRTYPPYIVEPVNEEDDGDDDNDDDDDDVVIITSCNLWFFNICIGGKFKSLKWTLPPGIYPPGPPPPDIIGPPASPKFTINPPLPPWPEITVGHDKKLTYSDEPSCKTESAELCSTTVTKSETLVGTITSTVTATASACDTVYGCSLTDWSSTTTTTPSVCAQPTATGGAYEPPEIGCPAPAIVYPKDPENVGSIPSLLQGYDDYVEVGLTTENWVAFYWIPMLGQDTMDVLRRSPDVSYAYYYEERNYNIGESFSLEDEFRDWDLPSRSEAPAAAGKPHDGMSSDDLLEDFEPDLDTEPSSLNDTLRFESRHDKRQTQFHVPRDTPFWGPSQVSLPKGSSWGSPGSLSFDPEKPNGDKYTYNYDVASALDTYMYALFDDGIWTDHSEFMGRSIEYLDSQHTLGPNAAYSPSYSHGSGVAAQVIGNQVGICPSCTLVVVTSEHPGRDVESWYQFPNEKIISHLIDTLDDVKKKKRQGKATVSMSFSYGRETMTPMFHIAFRQLLVKLDEQGVVVVASANNHALKKKEGIPVQRYPAKFADPNDQYGGFANMIVVAASNWKTEKADFSNYSPFVATFAPGSDIHCPADKFLHPGQKYDGLQGHFLCNVKKLIQLFARRFAVHGHNVDPAARRPIIWNGQVGEHSCLRDYGSKEDWAKVCPTIQDSLDDEPMNPGEPVEPCRSGQSGNPTRRRQDGGSCPLIPNDNGPGKNIDWEDGPSAPECDGDDHCGGELCKGYYCDPNPKISHPPDYYDPKDPQNPHGMPPQKPTSTSTTTVTSPTTTSSPPVKTLPLCLGSSKTPTSQYPIYAYSIYAPGLHCDGLFVSDANIGSSPPICDISNDEFSFDFCKEGDAKFVNEGPEFFSECGFQLSLNGKKYTPRQLDPMDDDNPCSGTCPDVVSVQGILLFEGMPACN
ncbi:Killer toxin subunits alpha/beta 6 [Penicillium samsonianum]|uniref:Killer toxin subunits alpha/beta 6 n=1 Tax=Penicillium samsonianum TaxID=1882272 RepID=UPI002549AD91|nr:Killer toxin subunits alpha/beta 6 [Penicillium samsonianum]KAJ6149090.1 Killer toxin subunits alpha/beta 6 [Penicillium samsonianum]